MTPKPSLIAVAALVGASTASAACLNPFGCEPKTYDECMVDATTRPTDAGVKLAGRECYRRFKQVEQERKAAEALKLAEQRAASWSGVGDAQNYAAVLRLMGKPDFTLEVARCSPVDGQAAAKDARCIRHLWMDRRPQQSCAKLGDCAFQIEVLEGTGGSLWAWWPSPQ